MKPTEIETVNTERAVARHAPSLDAVDILRAAVAGGVTTENVAVVERMVALVERQQDRQSEREYAAALSDLQSECENVVATKDVDGKFRYAPFLDIWNSVKPSIRRHGFTLQWDQEHHGDRIKVTLWLQHLSGHKRHFSWEMKIGSNAPGTPAGAQAPVLDTQTATRAKRLLLINTLNIVVDAVSSAEDVGDESLAGQEESDELFKRLLTLEPDDDRRAVSERRLLALAGATSWSAIPKAVLPVLNRLMAEKERAAAARKTP